MYVYVGIQTYVDGVEGHTYVCACWYVCMYVCTYACVVVCTYIHTNIRMYVYVGIQTYVAIYIQLIHTYTCTHTHTHTYTRMHACMYTHTSIHAYIDCAIPPSLSLPPHRLFGMLLMLYLSICLSVCLCIKNPLHRFFSLCLSLGLCHARLPLLLQAYPDPQHLFGQWPKHEILIPRRPPRRTGERVTSTARTR